MAYLKKPSSEDRVTMEIKVKHYDGTMMTIVLEDALETAANAVLDAGNTLNMKKVTSTPGLTKFDSMNSDYE